MFEYKVNYFYVFSDELLVDRINVPTNNKYSIMGVTKRDNPMFIGILVNEMKYTYCHVFKCHETITVRSPRKDGNLNMDSVPFKDILEMSDHVTSFGGMMSDVSI